jgi:hypothetical protein
LIDPRDPEANYLKVEILMSHREIDAAVPFLKNALQANTAILPRLSLVKRTLPKAIPPKQFRNSKEH